jgi:DnaK suppressor protein
MSVQEPHPEPSTNKAIGAVQRLVDSNDRRGQERGASMNSRFVEELAAMLRRKRSSLLLQEIVVSQSEADINLEDRESELEESAQKDRMTRLESHLSKRGQIMLRQIDEALERIDAGTFGECEQCGNEIGQGRLKAMPTAHLCIDCATELEKKQRSLGINGSNIERLSFREDEVDRAFGSE